MRDLSYGTKCQTEPKDKRTKQNNITTLRLPESWSFGYLVQNNVRSDKLWGQPIRRPLTLSADTSPQPKIRTQAAIYVFFLEQIQRYL